MYVKIYVKTTIFGELYCHLKKDNILKFNQYKTPRIIYADLDFLIKKIGGCPNNPEIFSTTEVGEHIPCGYSMSNI